MPTKPRNSPARTAPVTPLASTTAAAGPVPERPSEAAERDPRTPPLGLQALPAEAPLAGPAQDGDTLRLNPTELRALRATVPPSGATAPAAPTTAASSGSSAAPASSSSPSSASSPRTPARGIPAVASARRSAEAPAERGDGREDKDGEEAMTHTPSMESCIADLDLLMCSRNRSDDGEDRRARVQAERDKLTEKLRAKTQEAKELREARTGEIAPITEEIIDDGAGDL